MCRRPVSVLSLISCVFALAASAADEVPPAPEASFENSLGMKFKAVAGIPVLFSVYETRVSDFEAFIKAGTYKAWPSTLKPSFEQTPDHPAVFINLQDAIAFCNWLTQREQVAGRIKLNQSYRLPTNNEWDVAAGLASTKSKDLSTAAKVEESLSFIWGDQWPPPPGAGNFQSSEIPGYKDDYPFTAPVGKFNPTQGGLYDLAGNVWEWTVDARLSADAEGTLRGGSWAYFRRQCLTSAYVYKVPVNLRAPTIGFRCVFEDKKRTAEMLAAASAAELREIKKRQEEFSRKGDVDQAAVRRLMRGMEVRGDRAALAPATLTPAAPGQPFRQPLRLEFLPLPGTQILFGKTEVTLAAWQAFVKATARKVESQPAFTSSLTHPVVNVSWDDATALCAWLTEVDHKSGLLPAAARYRLPRDTEWSIAAGLPNEPGADPAARHLADKTQFPWGKGDQAWPPPPLSVNIDAPNVVPPYRDNYAKTAPVGSLLPSKDGIHDLGGNVCEWCEDPWPGAPGERVIRGGSWITSAREALYSSARQHQPKTASRFDLGFRMVVDFGP